MNRALNQYFTPMHAARYLWPHLTQQQAAEMMDSVLEGFN
jgi:hypothetical protein